MTIFYIVDNNNANLVFSFLHGGQNVFRELDLITSTT